MSVVPLGEGPFTFRFELRILWQAAGGGGRFRSVTRKRKVVFAGRREQMKMSRCFSKEPSACILFHLRDT